MKAFAFALGLGLAVAPGSTFAAAQGPPPVTQVLVTIEKIPRGAVRGVLTFSGIKGKVSSATVREFGAPAVAKPLNAGAARGFTLDFKPPYSGHQHVVVCFGPASPAGVRFVRGTWSFAPAMVIKPIDPHTVTTGVCGE
jgi:hypothetical protein